MAFIWEEGPFCSSSTIGGSRDRGVWHINFGINYGSISFGQLSGYIVFCILLIGGASPPIYVRYKVQCSQKVGQKKWSHNLKPKLGGSTLHVKLPYIS